MDRDAQRRVLNKEEHFLFQPITVKARKATYWL